MKNHVLFVGPETQSKFAFNKVATASAFSALLAAAVLSPVSAWALGLGKLNVQSALGEPLRAEIDVTSLNQEEGASLQGRVATLETYRAAGVDYNQVLTATSIVLQRRADGRPYLRIASDRAVQEPFVDVILDLSWSSGRLVREYTLLFDPPSTRAITPTTPPVFDAPTPVVTPVPAQGTVPEPAVQAAAPSKSTDGSTISEPLKSRNGKKAVPAAPEVAASAEIDAQSSEASPDFIEATGEPAVHSVRVKSGDSLSRIAGRMAKDGVSLDQMLVGLYRQNPKAFLGNNMNRLKSGVVLHVPSDEQAQGVSNEEARQIIVAQSADFAAYRQHLAGAVAATTPDQPQRQAKGKVEAEVQDKKQIEAPAPDKLTLSKGGMASPAKPAAEDRLAKSRAAQEDAARVAELTKNLDELRKLKEKTAAASAPSSVVQPAPAPAVVPSAPVGVESASAPASSSVAQAVARAASEAASTAATAVVEQASAPESAASSTLPSVPVPVAPAVDETEAPGFLESLNPMLLLSGGVAVALLAGGVMYLRSRRRRDTGETSFLESRLQPDSFFGASGGQRVDTSDAAGGPSSMSYSLSQLDAIGDVDPVAEADVYLAYGRDLQAEEILKEALRSTPDRLAVRTKLLEVYAKRRDTKGYAQLAVQLFNLTGGHGEDWAKAQEMGLGIDPENPLYQPDGQPSLAPLSVETPTDMLGASTIPHSVMPAPGMLEPTAPAMPAELLDLDLDISKPASLAEVTDSVSPPTTVAGDMPALELPEVEMTYIEPKPAMADTRPMDLPSIDDAAQEVTADGYGGLDFDLGEVPAQAPATAPASFDLSSISLDLDARASAQAPDPQAVPEEDWLTATASAPSALASDPMSRKFELADEFRQIGDVDGARELLQEVLENSQDATLKSKAQAMLDSLG